MAGGEELFSSEWGAQVRHILSEKKEEARNPLRVPEHLLLAKPEAYNPKCLSLGPYHFGKLKDVSEDDFCWDDVMLMSPEEEDNATHSTKFSELRGGGKCKFVATLCQKLANNGNGVDVIVEMMEGMREEMERFYCWPLPRADHYSNNFALMMAVDSLFLLRFLFGYYGEGGEHTGLIKCDILKLENQIPLSALRQVFEKVKASLPHRGLLVETAYKQLSQFNIQLEHSASQLFDHLAQPHLLGCIHLLVSPFLRIQDSQQHSEIGIHVVEKMCRIFSKPRVFPENRYTAGALARAAIKFKSFSTASDHIRFDKLSHTLYLPQMIVSSSLQTDVFFRNLLAFELNERNCGNNVQCFIQLMESLIYTPEDVSVLKKAQIICPGSGLSDDYIAKIWYSMRHPFNIGHVEPPNALKLAINDVLKKESQTIKLRIMYWKFRTKVWKLSQEFYELHLSRPWKAATLFVGILILAMNIIQAYCSLRGCNSSKNSTN